IEQGIIAIEDIAELGELALGLKKGRNNESEITYHKNNNGTAAAEIAIAMLVYEKAKAAGRGAEIDLISAEELNKQD
ncbi:MAG: hypothetical protein QGF09_16810, partial [Rhodospirillales bacterium]|nr:hypothetical protein [Rhodospirillales bacterium]